MFDIIIVTYNAKERLKKCIYSIEKYSKKSDYELTIVDNNSTDGTLAYLKKLDGRACIIETGRNGGFSYGANIGLKNTRNKYLFLLDDDVEVADGWLEGLYSCMKGKGNVGIVGGKVVFSDNRIFSADFSVKRDMRLGFGEIDRGQRDYIKESDSIPGPCWLMSRKAVQDVGYFDEAFFPCQYEDIDYCIRARLAGYKIIYNGKVRIVHHHLYRNKNGSRKNKLIFLRKWKGAIDKFSLKCSSPENKALEKGMYFFQRRDYAAALKLFFKARSFDKRFVEPYYMAIALYKKGFYEKAINELKEALSIYPRNHRFGRRVHYYLWSSYKRMDLCRKAGIEARKLLRYVQ